MTYENLQKFVDYLRGLQINEDNDVLMGVTGPRGCGKTSFSIQCSIKYVKKYFHEDYFSLRKYVAYNNKEVFEKLHTLPIYSPLIGDEAIRFAWSREWNKADSKELIKFAAQMRPKKHIFFMNIPKLVWMDKAYREGMIDIWVWIHAVDTEEGKKSYAMVFEPDENQGEADSWHLKEFKIKKRKIDRIGRFTNMDRIYNIIKNHPCFNTMFPFPKLPDDIYQNYLEIRKAKVMERESDYINQKDMAKILVYNLKQNWDSLTNAIKEGRFSKPTYRMIAEILSKDTKGNQLIQHTTVRNWVNDVLTSTNTLQNANNTTKEQNEKGA
jgi:hypothetical protein